MSDNQETKDVVIERTFNASLESVWNMWAKAENFQKWYGPTGASIPVANFDVQPGGKRHFCMEVNTPNGPMKMWFVGEYAAIEPMNKLSYTEIMADEEGNQVAPSSMGMPGEEVEVTTVTVELTEDGESTKMVMTHAGVPAGSPGEMGWNMALDKLAELFG